MKDPLITVIQQQKNRKLNCNLNITHLMPMLSSDETILQISMLPHLMPIMICIILLSTIVFLIIAILTTFCFLYRRMNPKNIYYVNEQGETKICYSTSITNDASFSSRKIIQQRLLRQAKRASIAVRARVHLMMESFASI